MSKELKSTIIVFVILAVVAVALFYNNDAPDYSKDTTSTPTQTQQVQNNQQNTTQNTTQNNAVGTIGDFIVTIDSSNLITDEDGTNRLLITYNFTNNSKDSESMAFAVDAKVYQDGVEIEQDLTYMILYKETLENDNRNKEILPGVSVKADYVYKLANTTSDVVIRVDKLVTFNPNPIEYRLTFN